MTETISIDINADVGEGLNNEAQLMPYLSSCNVACGGHAGDFLIMTEVVKLAKKYNVKIGAHPSFPDRINFGRLEMDISASDLYASLKQQINALQKVINLEGDELHHVKPHGALYNLAAKDKNTAKVVVEMIKSIDKPLKLYAPYKSVIAEIAKAEDIEVIYEAFADRNYNDDLSLVSRKKDNALLTEKTTVLRHVIDMVKYKNVKAISGVVVPIKASTFCVHGDTKSALEILKFLDTELLQNNIEIQ